MGDSRRGGLRLSGPRLRRWQLHLSLGHRLEDGLRRRAHRLRQPLRQRLLQRLRQRHRVVRRIRGRRQLCQVRRGRGRRQRVLQELLQHDALPRRGSRRAQQLRQLVVRRSRDAGIDARLVRLRRQARLSRQTLQQQLCACVRRQGLQQVRRFVMLPSAQLGRLTGHSPGHQLGRYHKGIVVQRSARLLPRTVGSRQPETRKTSLLHCSTHALAHRTLDLLLTGAV